MRENKPAIIWRSYDGRQRIVCIEDEESGEPLLVYEQRDHLDAMGQEAWQGVESTAPLRSLVRAIAATLPIDTIPAWACLWAQSVGPLRYEGHPFRLGPAS